MAGGVRTGTPTRLPASVCGSGADVVLLAIALIAATCSYATVARWYNITAVVLGVPAILLAVAYCRFGAPRWWTVGLALAITLVPQVAKPQTGEVDRRAALPWAVSLAFVGCLLLIAAMLPWLRRVRLAVLCATAVVAALALVLEIVGAARPHIDVWLIFQQASAGLFHGVNPYDHTYAHIPAGQTAGCYNYLPSTLLVSWAGWITLDEVRYAELAVLAAGWITLGIAGWRAAGGDPERRFRVLSLLGVAVVLVGTMRVTQQAWNESIAVGFMMMAAGLISLGRRNWAVVALGAALATKQHMVLLLPLFALWRVFGWRRALCAVAVAAAISAPWVVWNPVRFTHCTVTFFIDLPARKDSLSVWQYLPGPIGTPVVLLLVLGTLVLAVRRLPHTLGGLLVGAGATLASFNFANKQTFQNQWWIAGELLLCGLAFCSLESAANDEAARPG